MNNTATAHTTTGQTPMGAISGTKGNSTMHLLSKDTTAARSAAIGAGQARSRALLMVATGQRTAFDVVLAAMGPDGGPLRRIRLDQLVLAQPNVGQVRAKTFLSEVAARLDDVPTNIGSKDILWLTVPRAGAKRLHAWMDASVTHRPLWLGYPLAPRPQEITASTAMTKDH